MMRRPAPSPGSAERITAAPPSEIGQQSISFSGSAMVLEPITSSTVIGAVNCAPGVSEARRRISTASSASSAWVAPVSCR